MPRKRLRTLPETERKDSKKSSVNILAVDKAANTIYAQVNGCNITAVCQEQANKEIYDRVKGILISTVIS